MVYGRYNELVNGVYKPTYNWGAPSSIKSMWFSIGFMFTRGIKAANDDP
jgi:hypothetical protein